MLRPGTPEQMGLPEISGGDWYTPDWLFRELDEKFGPFTLDAAALPTNTKCVGYFTPEQDGRVQPWRGVVWCNPPYVNLIEWVRHAYEEVKAGRAQRVCLLLPAQTSTEWFHDYALPHAKLHWIRGKVKFGGRDQRALMPSLAVVFEGEGLNG